MELYGGVLCVACSLFLITLFCKQPTGVDAWWSWLSRIVDVDNVLGPIPSASSYSCFF